VHGQYRGFSERISCPVTCLVAIVNRLFKYGGALFFWLTLACIGQELFNKRIRPSVAVPPHRFQHRTNAFQESPFLCRKEQAPCADDWNFLVKRGRPSFSHRLTRPLYVLPRGQWPLLHPRPACRPIVGGMEDALCTRTLGL